MPPHALAYVNQRAVHRYLWMVHRRMVRGTMNRESRDALFFEWKIDKQKITPQQKKKITRRRAACAARRKFPCRFCDYRATFKGNLTRHVKKYH
ncbi:MAG: hypothetical protein CL450_07390 [Acidimicrobiaceae bacterium]|nr:hypothetical protein [Acidimicrobiaceae bacterium]